MRGVGPLEPRLAFRRDRADVAADISRRQSKPTQTRNHDVGEVLTDAAAFLEGHRERRANVRRFRVVAKIAADAAHELRCGIKNRTRRCKTFTRVIDRRLKQRHETARIEKMRGRLRIEAFGIEGFVPHLFPCGRTGRRAGPIDLDARSRLGPKFTMWRLDSCVDDAVAEKAAPLIRFDRLGRDFKPALDHALPRSVLRQTAQVAARIGDGRAVGANRDVAKIVQQSGAPSRRTLRRQTAQFNILWHTIAGDVPRHSCNFSEHAWVLPIDDCTKKRGSDSQLPFPQSRPEGGVQNREASMSAQATAFHGSQHLPSRGDASHSVYSKINWRIVPLLLIAYMVAYLDRINIGYAQLQMKESPAFGEAVYGLGARISFLR